MQCDSRGAFQARAGFPSGSLPSIQLACRRIWPCSATCLCFSHLWRSTSADWPGTRLSPDFTLLFLAVPSHWDQQGCVTESHRQQRLTRHSGAPQLPLHSDLPKSSQASLHPPSSASTKLQAAELGPCHKALLGGSPLADCLVFSHLSLEVQSPPHTHPFPFSAEGKKKASGGLCPLLPQHPAASISTRWQFSKSSIAVVRVW